LIQINRLSAFLYLKTTQKADSRLTRWLYFFKVISDCYFILRGEKETGMRSAGRYSARLGRMNEKLTEV